MLIVSELSRVGRSVVEVITIIDGIIKKQGRFIAIKQNFNIQGNHDIQSKVLLTIFALLAELELCRPFKLTHLRSQEVIHR